jgi:hypothetical protein
VIDEVFVRARAQEARQKNKQKEKFCLYTEIFWYFHRKNSNETGFFYGQVHLDGERLPPLLLRPKIILNAVEVQCL